MWTIFYKHAFIHGHIQAKVCRVQWAGLPAVNCKSLHAAKILITKYPKGSIQ